MIFFDLSKIGLQNGLFPNELIEKINNFKRMEVSYFKAI